MIYTPQNRSQVATLLDAQALQPDRPDTTVVIFVASDADATIVTRRSFYAETRRYAAALNAHGISSDDLVMIAHTDILHSMYAFWGALLIGAIPSLLPTLSDKLDPMIYQRNLHQLVQRSKVRAVITDSAHVETLAGADGQVYASDALLTRGTAMPENAPPIHADKIAFLQHSSGTTGLQKGVALTHRAVLNQVTAYADALDLRETDVIVSWLPLYHDMGLIAAFIQPLVQGIPLVLMSPFDWVAHPALLLKTIHQYGGTLCWQPNFAYNHLAERVRMHDSDGVDLSGMRAWINCSEPVRHDSHVRFLTRFANNGVRADHLAVSYAMAENTFAVTQTRTGKAARIDWVDGRALQSALRAVPVEANTPVAQAHVSCGAVIANSHVKVVGHDGAELPERCVGELYVRSDCMLSAYYQRPDLHPFDADGWYHTGDRGYMAHGELFVIGRSKDVIIHAGKNIYPHDIEAAVNDIDGIHAGRAVAFGVPDAREGTELIAVVAEAQAHDAAARKQITQRIRQSIARQNDVTVTFVTLVEAGWLIKTSSGKIARGANREKWQAQFGGDIA